ncbi:MULTISPECIES: amino acid ABC transporter permease [Leuconostoc]|uniref:Glutamine ABC transporter, permease protein n=2 Tax=Leuconostoc kimchii TaxID=136609 RepID=D5T292_LEUKI|nr:MULTISPECIES: amino acid ABC transporter permease [Leuconostoc]ADG40391.1 glutamine ABC transporter, permease protein [Leuconostoc kimchii IMSNU 11154]AEJ31684.1 ABC-type amino acid transport system, permease component [Leuconostoc sp. C2]QBR46873.1 amino acid ABC transporter permease [Leuconostoc kimchii]
MVTLGIFSAFTPQNVLYLLGGLGITVGVSVISVILSLIFGSVVGIIQFERLPFFSKFVGTINNVIRNLPLLLIIFFVYFALPKIGIHLPIFWATVIAMSTFESAMLAEIVRGGLESVDIGQFEGARANGLSNMQTMIYIILPQAYKRMIPPIISQLISLVKDTSLAMGIVLSEMTYRGQIVYAQNSTYIIPVLIAITLVYFLLNYGLSLIARWADHKLA